MTPTFGPTYEEARDAVIYGEDCDVFAARETAYHWHNGMWSALYSFASTDCTVHSPTHRVELEGDVERCIEVVKMRLKEGREQDENDIEALENLLRTVTALPIKNPEVQP